MASVTNIPHGTARRALRTGSYVRISPNAGPFYRKGGSPREGVVVEISPSERIARVRLDDVADTYIRIEDLEIISNGD